MSVDFGLLGHPRDDVGDFARGYQQGREIAAERQAAEELAAARAERAATQTALAAEHQAAGGTQEQRAEPPDQPVQAKPDPWVTAILDSARGKPPAPPRPGEALWKAALDASYAAGEAADKADAVYAEAKVRADAAWDAFGDAAGKAVRTRTPADENAYNAATEAMYSAGAAVSTARDAMAAAHLLADQARKREASAQDEMKTLQVLPDAKR